MQPATEIEPALPPVRMDENAMTLVLLNLVDNAVKYAAEGGEVDVRLRRVARRRWRWRCATAGAGIAARGAAAHLRALLSRPRAPASATCAAAASAWRW